MPKKKYGAIVYIAIVVALMFAMYFMMSLLNAPVSKYKYSDVVYMFSDNVVSEFSLNLGSGDMTMVLNKDNPKITELEGVIDTKDGEKIIKYAVPHVGLFLEDIKPAIEAHNQTYPDSKIGFEYIPAKDNSWLVAFLPQLLLIGLMVFFFFFIMRQAGGGGKMNNFGKINAKTTSQEGKKATFADVAGCDEEKEEMSEIVDFLKNPAKFNDLGARIPKGVLLMGPPGTGKTLLARAVAGEAGVPFYSISGSDFVEMYVGVGASRVRSLFEESKKTAPSIVFIDEIDAVGRHRGAGLGGGHDEREQTLNQLLVEMDGFGENSGVIVIAATNRKDILDPALLRPGRFDRHIVVNFPDVKGREEILHVHSRNKPLGFDVDLNKIARTTAGFTGADLENLMNEAALLAARKGKKAITEMDIEEATIKVVAGPEKKSHKISDKDKEITAYHEAGHAVATFYSKTQDKVHEVSIIPRGMAAGYTMHLPSEDKTHVSRKQMYENIVVLLSGRVAEEIFLDDICTGASNDIERATQTARSMITKFGFSNTLGPIQYGQDEGEVFLGRDINHKRNYSENIAAEIDAEIRELIDKSYQASKEILSAHKEQVERVTAYLIENEKINGDIFNKLMNNEEIIIPKRETSPVTPVIEDISKDISNGDGQVSH